MRTNFHRLLKRVPEGKAQSRLAFLFGALDDTEPLELQLTDEERETFGRDALNDIIEHVDLDDEARLRRAAGIACLLLIEDGLEARNGRV